MVHISEKLTGSIFRAVDDFLDCLKDKLKVNWELHRNVGNYLPTNTASYPVRLFTFIDIIAIATNLAI